MHNGCGEIDYGSLDSLGRPTGVSATLDNSMLHTGSSAKSSIRPPGFAGQSSGHARGHLLAKQLGGSGTDERNLVTLFQNPVNTPIMRGFENQIKKAIEAGEIIKYRVTPDYIGNSLIPDSIHMVAIGDRGFQLDVTIKNI